MNISTIIYKTLLKVEHLAHMFWMHLEKKQLGACGKNVVIMYPNRLNSSMFIGNNVNIYSGGLFMIGPKGRFVMKDNSGASHNLTVITGNHGHMVGVLNKVVTMDRLNDTETTITVEEDARIGANVTLLPGVTVGRGSRVGACSVVTKDVPPYSIVAGNPARVLRFIFTPDEIIRHEQTLYPENERISLATLTDIQDRYKKK